MTSPAEEASFENYPLQPPPAGQTSNFIDPESRGPTIVILCSVFIGLMWPILILRLYSKARVIRKFGWDDGKELGVLFSVSLLICQRSIRVACCGMHLAKLTMVALTPTR